MVTTFQLRDIEHSLFERRRSIEQLASEVLHLADITFDFLEVTAKTQKQVVFDGGGKRGLLGNCDEGSLITVYYNQHSQDKRKRVHGVVHTTVHEGIHAVRDEYYETDTLVEHAVSEGMAHYANHKSGHELGLLGAPDYPAMIKARESLESVADLRVKLIQDNPLVSPHLEGTPLVDKIEKFWLGRPSDNIPMQRLAIVGFQAVWNKINDGAMLQDLMKLPAHEVLGLFDE